MTSINSLLNRASINIQNHKTRIATAAILTTASAITAATVPVFSTLGITFAAICGAFALYTIIKPISSKKLTIDIKKLSVFATARLYKWLAAQNPTEKQHVLDVIAQMEDLIKAAYQQFPIIDPPLNRSSTQQEVANHLDSFITKASVVFAKDLDKPLIVHVKKKHSTFQYEYTDFLDVFKNPVKHEKNFQTTLTRAAKAVLE